MKYQIVFWISLRNHPSVSGMLSAALLFSNFQEGGIGICVASRTVVWLSLEQRRFEFVPVFHGLQGRLAAQG